jgi:hypothetical protein
MSHRPNPCRGAAELVLSVPGGPEGPEGPASPEGRLGAARLAIHDLEGRMVRELPCGRLAPGEVRLAWDGLDEAGKPAPAGVYFCRLALGGRPVVTHALVMRR